MGLWALSFGCGRLIHAGFKIVSTQQTASASSQGLVVLVADDDPIFRHLAVSRLVPLDCKILEAEDGAEAWRLTRDHTIELAIVDFEMPCLDGIALIQCLRSHPHTRHIPIIMCTSRCDRSAMQAALEAGASSFINKPVNWSMFETHIGHLLSLSRAETETSNAIERLETILEVRDAQVAKLLADLQRAVQDEEPDVTNGMVATLQATITKFAADYEGRKAKISELGQAAGAQHAMTFRSARPA